MRPITISNHAVDAIFAAASLICGAGVWTFLHGSGKNGLDTLPLGWLLALLTTPILSLACVVCMWHRKRTEWVAASATVLATLQCGIWCLTVLSVLYYL
jgi:hypothetical protein